ncbi:MAG: hypothetical protein DRJ42_12055 [Deltaproteobacteria bacterium]|nr:MAG: hypothetical protein DRJ42_12055 [Deltaproteobacteria bacterium]
MAISLLTACGDDGGASDTGADGGTDGGTDSGRMAVGPNIPWLDDGVPPVALTPCPTGWREVTGGDVVECDPYPEGGAETCGVGEAHFPGEAGCRTIGDACPAGDFATDLPADARVVYVNAAAAAGGDGTLASPYAGLSQVSWSSLAAGTTVALARGTYEGTLPLKAGVRVVGACVAETFVTGVSAPVLAVVTVTNAGEPAVVRNITLLGTPQRAVDLDGGRSLTLEGVLIDRSSEYGCVVSGEGTTLTLSDTVVRDTQPSPADSSLGYGVNVSRGARLDATRLILAENREISLAAFDAGTVVTVTDAVVRDTQPSAAGGYLGRGVNMQDGARFEATRLLVIANREVGIFAAGPGSSALVLVDTIVRDTQSQASDGRAGQGIFLQVSASLEATRLLVAGNHDIGISASREGCSVALVDTVIRDTAPQARDGAHGRGVNLQEGARLDATRLLILRNHEAGIFAAADGTAMTLVDTAVRDTRSQASDGAVGRGITVQDRASLDGTRVVVDRAHEVGVIAVTGAVVELRDVSITRVQQVACAETSCPERTSGYAAASVAATLRITGFEIRDAAVCGVFLSPDPGFPEAPSVDLQSGVVADALIGVCVQSDGYDLDRLTQDVEYLDNGTNLDVTMLPVPSPVGGIAP